MLNIGIIGLGSMGMTHFSAYAALPDVRVVAVADQKFSRPEETVGRAGNIAGQSAAVDLTGVKKYVTAEELLADPEVTAVDICTPTLLHKTLALAAICAGKKAVLVEKPLARTAAEAREVLAAAEEKGTLLFPAHCMRFWPGWDWLKTAVAEACYGAVQSAAFTRLGAKPPVPLYNDAEAIGGAHLDLHIHDADFVQHVFGRPVAVTSFGRKGESGAIEHTITHYHFSDSDALVTAEGGWTRDAEKIPFVMRYAVTFERATAVYELGEKPSLRLYQAGKTAEEIPLADSLGYANELAEFVRCARAGQPSPLVNGADGVAALKLIEAELESIAAGKTINL